MLDQGSGDSPALASVALLNPLRVSLPFLSGVGAGWWLKALLGHHLLPYILFPLLEALVPSLRKHEYSGFGL